MKILWGFSRRGLKIVYDLHHWIPLMGSYSFYSVHVDLQWQVTLESKAISPYLQHGLIKEQNNGADCQHWLYDWLRNSSVSKVQPALHLLH